MVNIEKEAEETIQFVTDRMLGKLSTWLRILGYDTIYAAEVKGEFVEEDESLAALAEHEARILLTRDKILAASAKRRGVQCVHIKTGEVMGQLKELLRHYPNINLEPVSIRCSECNGRLRNVVEEEEEDILREKSYVPTSMIGECEFWICNRCGRIYWEGSHWRNMRERLKQLQ
uniref:Mut7-C RNAse domain-containing protein n=1 Tax=Candidatus Methanophaga sp. ANME-1 ERB7 TaxID=2759913 RepID=A0A7G9ZCM4_9EURY|nr:hypothetical protein FKBFPHBB_00009 [Methanosarcinales archaeon ANME-1 ERB7]